ncbi:MAG TPA: tripartite tricarboxylate transporter substrate binding protein [Burkholderiaceae bacterium]|nr:tripartite tricarboxylate transporter substrate binding protein [Burkholderiaceae bacterium]
MVLSRGILFLCALLVTSAAAAQTWPTKPIRLIVPYAPGGSADITARLISPRLGDSLGQPVIVENRPGAATQIATEAVVKSAPDGYTLLVGPAPMTVNPWLYPNLPYDVRKDLEPIVLMNLVPSYLMVNADLPVKSPRELVAWLKANPAKTSYASAGNGTLLHLGGEWFKSVTSTDAVHVPFKGSGPAVVGLASGQVQYSFENLGPALPQIQAGKIRVLGVAGNRRAVAMPDLPTLAELGLPPFEAAVWFSLVGPAGLPKSIVARVNAEVNRILADADVRERFRAMGLDAVGGTPEDLARHIGLETEKWGKLVREKNIKAD